MHATPGNTATTHDAGRRFCDLQASVHVPLHDLLGRVPGGSGHEAVEAGTGEPIARPIPAPIIAEYR